MTKVPYGSNLVPDSCNAKVVIHRLWMVVGLDGLGGEGKGGRERGKGKGEGGGWLDVERVDGGGLVEMEFW